MAPRCPPSDPMLRQRGGAPALDATRSNRAGAVSTLLLQSSPCLWRCPAGVFRGSELRFGLAIIPVIGSPTRTNRVILTLPAGKMGGWSTPRHRWFLGRDFCVMRQLGQVDVDRAALRCSRLGGDYRARKLPFPCQPPFRRIRLQPTFSTPRHPPRCKRCQASQKTLTPPQTQFSSPRTPGCHLRLAYIVVVVDIAQSRRFHPTPPNPSKSLGSGRFR